MSFSLIKLIKKSIPEPCLVKWRNFRYPSIRPTKTAFGDKYVYQNDEGSQLIRCLLLRDRPCLVARFGWNELETTLFFLKKSDSRKIVFPDWLKKAMGEVAGFFPADDSSLARFASESIEILRKDIDILGVATSRGDEILVRRYGQELRPVQFGCIGDGVAFLKKPWTIALEGKKVLVIHPFENSIRAQYEKRELLFHNKNVLPAFTLLTFKPWQSAGNGAEAVPFETWFEALEDMCGRIGKIDFDIALIGAGAYGMFLGAYCKSIGKKAVHVGGALQLLFGIKGARWEKDYPLSFREKLFNRHWINPSEEERPPGMEKIEGACYW